MKKINLFIEKKNCCGCGACYQSCPQNAILMVEDEKGGEYPEIDYEKCIGCGLCVKTCNYQSLNKYNSLKETYAAYSKSTNLKESASGGIFSSFAKSVLEDDGIVYGAAMFYKNNKLEVQHIEITVIEDLIKLKGSKYVQSSCNQVYPKIKKQLEQGKIILFSGTPCQVDGLYGYLKKEYKTLYTIEVICHGVPSQKLFNDYIAHIESKRKIKIIDFKFREKSKGWKLFGMLKYIDGNGNINCDYFEPEESSYYQMFLNSYTYRENCYSCPYASKNRVANITIGDYWCIDLVHPQYLKENGGMIDEHAGVSTMIINNVHGKLFFNEYGKNIALFESTYKDACRYNKQLIHPSILPSLRSKVFSMYEDAGYIKVEKWYKRRLLTIKIKRKLISMIPKRIKDFMKKFLKKI
ncbi:Coenzyme F420 hydrogenase/dehydrogenase, beta subunit C-terminal domain [Thomasclavelia cocleata]|uniref:Coenzyme F420 hydrogenase/dehydrogenase, beta subunit C-terminal domain n=1 Tax=Thomasclavelia cocleata TaxID=69824 RepID=UPI00242C621C|nr:Coenzyme F420 hydrogenase/dehydrogenase, beta subunit C-terminal domain [Thomasclavelia cocleata]